MYVMRIAHISDTHLGYEAYRTVSGGGENQRGTDVIRAFVRCVDDIVEWDPDLVIHSGDVAEKPNISVRMMLLIRQQFARLAGERKDGTMRPLIVIAGNHDMPSASKEACFLELYRDMPGVEIVCVEPRVVKYDTETLLGLSVTCVPHEALKDLALEERFEEVAPIPGRTNILVSHGVAGGSSLYRRVLGREYTIPTDVIVRDWDYAALGHWHKQGPVGAAGKAWYAGSTENMGFGDLRDNGDERGYLRVTIEQGRTDVHVRNLPIRQMLRLPVIDASEKNIEEIEEAIQQNIEKAKADNKMAGSIVGQHVMGCSREKWALVPVAKIRERANETALYYEVTLIKPGQEDAESVSGVKRGDNIMEVIEARAQVVLSKTERDGGLKVAKELLERNMKITSATEETAEVPK